MRALFKLEKTPINVDWKVLKIKRVLDTPITDGPHETPDLLDEGIPFLSAESVKKGKLDFNLKRGYISREDHEKYIKKCKPQRDDIFMVKSGATTGNAAMVETDEEFSIWSPLALIRADREKIHPKYLYFFIGSDAFKEQVEISWSFGTQQNIGMKVIENLFIALPPLHLQEKLVHYIENKVVQIDKLIDMKEQKITLLEQQRQSIITEAVTKGLNPNVKMKDSGVEWIGEIPEHWTKISVRNLLRNNVLSTQDGNHGELHPTTDDYVDKGIPFVMANNIRKNRLNLKDCKFISEELANTLRIGFSKSGDVLLTHKGTIGEVAVVPTNINTPYIMLTPQVTYYRIIKSNLIINKYLFYYFQSKIFKEQIKLISSMQSTRSYIGLVAQKELLIILPLLEDQIGIIRVLDEETSKLQKIIDRVELQIEKLREYRQSLIYEAVTGKIDIRDMELD